MMWEDTVGEGLVLSISMHNLRTGKMDDFPASETPSDYSDYIPQTPDIQNLYKTYILCGYSPRSAALEIWQSMEKENDNGRPNSSSK